MICGMLNRSVRERDGVCICRMRDGFLHGHEIRFDGFYRFSFERCLWRFINFGNSLDSRGDWILGLRCDIGNDGNRNGRLLRGWWVRLLLLLRLLILQLRGREISGRIIQRICGRSKLRRINLWGGGRGWGVREASGEGSRCKSWRGDLEARHNVVVIVHSLPKIFVIIFFLCQSFDDSTSFLQGAHEALTLVSQAGDAALERFEINLFAREKSLELWRWGWMREYNWTLKATRILLGFPRLLIGSLEGRRTATKRTFDLPKAEVLNAIILIRLLAKSKTLTFIFPNSSWPPSSL